jgi:hypothetical protein
VAGSDGRPPPCGIVVVVVLVDVVEVVLVLDVDVVLVVAGTVVVVVVLCGCGGWEGLLADAVSAVATPTSPTSKNSVATMRAARRLTAISNSRCCSWYCYLPTATAVIGIMSEKMKMSRI